MNNPERDEFSDTATKGTRTNPSGITIPPEVVEAAGEAFLQKDFTPSYSFDDCILAAIAAALNAWPGAEVHNFDGWTHAEGLVLPLPQEARDD